MFIICPLYLLNKTKINRLVMVKQIDAFFKNKFCNLLKYVKAYNELRQQTLPLLPHVNVNDHCFCHIVTC